MAVRVEEDSMGKIEVPADRYYGAQTARSLIHFAIGDDRMPRSVLRAFGVLKKAAALVNGDLGLFKRKKDADLDPVFRQLVTQQMVDPLAIDFDTLTQAAERVDDQQGIELPKFRGDSLGGGRALRSWYCRSTDHGDPSR